MRDFSWKYFMTTGTVDAYLLYKEYEKIDSPTSDEILIPHDEIAASEETYR